MQVIVVTSGNGEAVGGFQVEHLPRIGETLNVAWTADPQGYRSFQVVDVDHFAAGLPVVHEQFATPCTVLMCEEIH